MPNASAARLVAIRLATAPSVMFRNVRPACVTILGIWIVSQLSPESRDLRFCSLFLTSIEGQFVQMFCESLDYLTYLGKIGTSFRSLGEIRAVLRKVTDWAMKHVLNS